MVTVVRAFIPTPLQLPASVVGSRPLCAHHLSPITPRGDPVRGPPDVYVRPRRGAGDGEAEGGEGDAGGAQVLHERAPLGAVGAEADVHRVVVVVAPAVVHRRLPERAD